MCGWTGVTRSRPLTLERLGTSSPLCWSHWQSVGPFHVAQTYPGINDLTDPEDIGSASDIWLNGSTAYLASVNGGVWRTNNISGIEAYGGPHWEALTDHIPCTSISAISGSKDDTNIIVAGCGFPSNAAGRGSEPLGVMMSKDGGATWAMTAFPRGFWVSDVLIDSRPVNNLVRTFVSAKQGIRVRDRWGNMTDPYGIGNSTGGIWLSRSLGSPFVQVYPSSAGGENHNLARVNRIIQDPLDADIFYASLLVYPNQPMDQNILLIKSTDMGTSWFPWLTPNFTRQCPGRDQIENSQLTIVGSIVYAGFYLTQSNSTSGIDTSCYAFFKSSNGEAFTDVIGVPSQDSLGSLGSSGSTHFIILAVPTAPDTLFVAGGGHAVYRVDTDENEWTLISTVSRLNTTVNATRSGTAPHADANRFEWNAVTNELLLTNGGSVYRRTNPFGAPNEGDWFSLSGDLAITEIHDFSLDSSTGTIFLVSQDNSFMMSQFDGTEANTGMWSFVSRTPGDWTGRGGSDVYHSFYGADRNLRHFFEGPSVASTNCSAGTGTCLHSVVSTDSESPTITYLCTGGTTTIPDDSTSSSSPSSSSPATCYTLHWSRSFQSAVIPLEFNSDAFDLNGAPTTFDILLADRVPNVLFAAGVGYTWSRAAPCDNTTCISIVDQCTSDSCNLNNFVNRRPPWSATGKPLRFVQQNDQAYYQMMVVDGIGHIYLTIDFGQTYIDLNLPEHSNLLNISGHTSVDTFSTGAVMFLNLPYWYNWYSEDPIQGCLLVGIGNGIFYTLDDPASTYFTFHPLGVNLPKTVVTSFAYHTRTDTLYVSTFGRGLWAMQAFVWAVLPELSHTDHLNPACLRPLYPNVPNAYGYIPPPNPLPDDIGFPLKEIIVWGMQYTPLNGSFDIPLNGSFTFWISATTGFPPVGIFLLKPTITTPGDHGYFTPENITLFWDGPQEITFQSTGTEIGQLNFTTQLLGDSIYLGFQPFSTTFNICNGNCSDPSSFSSSTGHHSSSSSSSGVMSSSSTGIESSTSSTGDSSSGPSVDSSSSTGSSDPLNVTIPNFLPSFTLSFLTTTPNHDSSQFRQLLSKDLAQACSVDSNRVMILEKVGGSNSIDFTFTITPLLLSTPTMNDFNTSLAGDSFLVATSYSGSTFFTLPIGQYAIVGSGVLTPYPSNAISQLQQVSFGLNYDINNIPGGNTIKSFSSLILADVATACSIPVSRLYMLCITAGSIQASFTISPNITADEPSAAQVIQTFLSESQNPNSLLYSGATTSATIQGSTTVGVPGSSIPLPDDTPSNNNRRLMLIGIGCGIGGGILLCCLILVCCRQKRINSISSSSGNGRTKGGVYTPSMLGQPAAGSMELSEIAVQTSPNQYAPLQ